VRVVDADGTGMNSTGNAYVPVQSTGVLTGVVAIAGNSTADSSIPVRVVGAGGTGVLTGVTAVFGGCLSHAGLEERPHCLGMG
jgi:hypothetical protein